jgi:hypothetical protein
VQCRLGEKGLTKSALLADSKDGGSLEGANGGRDKGSSGDERSGHHDGGLWRWIDCLMMGKREEKKKEWMDLSVVALAPASSSTSNPH